VATNQTLIHYALDLETPPLIACDAKDIISSPDPADVTCPRCMKNEHFPLGALRKPLHPDQERALIRAQGSERPIVRPYDVLMTAADLLSDDGENAEYDRAITEITSILIWGTTEDTEKMTRILRSLTERH